MPTISGTVYDYTGAAAAGRIVRAYRRDTGALLGQTTTGTGVAIPGDPSYANVSLLLHCDGANGSTTFTDSSAAPHTITANGGAALSTAQSKFGGASLTFGSGGYAAVISSSRLDVSSGDYTVEMWIRPAAIGVSAILVNKAEGTAAGYPYQAFVSASGGLVFRSYNASLQELFTITTAGGFFAAGVWAHVALVRRGSIFTVYINGVGAGSATYAGALPSNSSTLSIGAYNNGASPFTGHIDEFRLTKGVARYTANFTPPTAPFPDYTETPAAPLGTYALNTGSYSGECNVICLDDDAGTVYNDLIKRVTPA